MSSPNSNTTGSREFSVGGRSTEIKNLKVLKTPEEGGTKKEYEEYLDKIKNHVSINWEGGWEMKELITSMKEPSFKEPKDLTDDEEKSKLKTAMWNMEVHNYVTQINLFKRNKGALFAFIMNNVSKITKGKLKSNVCFSKKETEGDLIWLLEALDDIVVKFEKVKPRVLSLDDQLERVMTMRQSERMNNDDFINLMKKEVDIYEKHGGRFLWADKEDKEVETRLKEFEKLKADNKQKVAASEKESEKERIQTEIKEKILAMAIIKRSCQKRFKELMVHCKNEFLFGKDIYPTTTAEVLKLLNNYECNNPTTNDSRNTGRSRGSSNTNVSFLQSNGSNVQVEYLRGTNRSFHPSVTCRRCGIKGHYHVQCPVATNERGSMLPNSESSSSSSNSTSHEEAAQTETNNNQEGNTNNEQTSNEVSRLNAYGLSQKHSEAYINPYWILLDSESSEHIFNNKELLEDIKSSTNGEVLRLHSNGGYIETNMKAKFGNFDVWYSPKSLANILSLALVTEEYRVTLDTGIDNTFIIHITEYHNIEFRRHCSGLYYFDASKVDLEKLKEAFNFLNTVTSNKSMYGKREIRKAEEANLLNRRTNHIAKDKFLRIIKDNWIRNVPFTLGDVRRSHIIYGPPIPPIKGRTRYKVPSRIPDAADIIQIPRELYDDMKYVTLCADFHFVNGVTVFHTISRKINYRTVSFPISRSSSSILNELSKVYKIYNARGFQIIEIHADSEFEKIRSSILPIRLKTVATDEHVPEIERSIQTQKNENRAVCYAMPYKCIPRIMVREIVNQGNAFLNAFGDKDTLARGLSPRNIIDNLPHIDYNDLKYEFGEYIQLHVNEYFKNNMKSRTIGAIVLGPNNITGTYNFMSLESGAMVSGRVVAQLPITDDVIARVEEFGINQKQPYRNSRMLAYEWKPGIPVDGNDLDLVSTSSPPTYDLIIPPRISQHEGRQSQPVSHQGADQLMLNDDGRHMTDRYYQQHESTSGQNDAGSVTILHIADPTTAFVDQGVGVGYGQTNEGNENQGARVGYDQGASLEGGNKEFETSESTEEKDENEGASPGRNEGAFQTNEYKDEGAQPSENEGAFPIEDEYSEESSVTSVIVEHQNKEGIEVIIDEGERDGDIDDDISSVEERREAERERRKEHFKEHEGEEYGRGKRVKKPNQSYSFLQTEFKSLSTEEKESYFEHAWNEYKVTGTTNMLEKYTTGLVFAQMSARQGISKYKEEAERMLIKEFEQLLEYQTFHGVKASSLTHEQRRKAGNMINLIEEKLNRGHTPENPVLKGRSCFNGRVQRGLYTKEQTSSPTVSQDSFFLTCIIDAVEGRSKAITDIKGAYLNAKMKDVVIMKIVGPEVDMFCNLDASFRKFITYEKGKKVLYTQLDKALYGCVQSALLWYELYSDTLKDMGFTLNPYDLCVANSMINGKQCTVCWYVDDNKISHEDPNVIESVIKQIENKFGKMTKTIGDEHDFLGMHIKYKNKKVEVSMKKHILKAINEFMDEITRNAATPAKHYLFNVRESTKLDEERAENFHSVVALLLFVSRRCRLDIQTAVAFLTTRVSEPTLDDWNKLKRVLQYLRGTIDLKLTLGADDILKAKTWVDVSYGVHDDCRSHTGGAISWGWGVLLTKCQKQKLNTKSSTEGEIVGLSDFLPNVIWARMFLEEQGYILKENIVYQDNMSAMKLAKNGKQSSGQKTKHINNRYFWIKDRITKEGISIQYCPTERMVADFFTKPLQGTLFRRFRDIILGYEHISVLDEVKGDNISEERVSNNEYLPVEERGNIINGGTAKLHKLQPEKQPDM